MKPGRNDPCPCGSGKKYKLCCQRYESAGTSPNATKANNPSSVQLDYIASLFNSGRYLEMERYADTLVTAHPDSGICWKALGIALQAQGKDGLQALQRTAVLLPDDAETHRNLGILLQSRGRLSEAEVSHRRALALKPGLAEAHKNLGVVLSDQEKWTEAEACFRKTLKIQPDNFEAESGLAKILLIQGKSSEAESSYRRALKLKPDFANGHFELGVILKRQNKSREAITCFNAYLAIDPDDVRGCKLLLASMGVEPLPAGTSKAQLDALYASRAKTWDDEQQTPYRGAELVARTLQNLTSESPLPRVLDAGCGTGLVGELIQHMVSQLDGVDMSPHMLEKAKEKGIYHQLAENDLVSFMESHPKQYDAITSAATLIHFGDLSPAFKAAATCLKEGGLFVFTLFPNDTEPNGQEVIVADSEELARGGCFAHSRHYVTRLAESSGFAVESLTDEVHEFSQTSPVMGMVVALRYRPT